MTRQVVTVFGASGFIGRAVVRKLAEKGYVVRAAVRDPIAAEILRPMGDVGQINLLRIDIRDAAKVRAAVEGATAVVNLVGILAEGGKRTFQNIHVTGAANIAKAATEAGVTALVHLSALGASKESSSAYARTKAEGEAEVLAAFPKAVILRPSVVFGTDDNFFNRFAKMAWLAPALPVFTRDGLKLTCGHGTACLDFYGSGGPVFQPVWVSDVAQAIVTALDDPELAGKVFELGGPKRYSFKELMELVVQATDRHPLLVPLPFWAARLMAKVLQFAPGKPLTPDQVRLMETDNVVRGGKPGLAELGIVPTSPEDIVPGYLQRYKSPSPSASMG